MSVRIALLGCGTVGREVAARLAAREDVDLVSVLVRDLTKDRGVDPALLTDRFEDVLAATPDVIIELIGGLEPAGVFVERALECGVDVVTANKTLISRRGDRLEALCARTGARLGYEAAVCAGVPVIASLRQLGADRVLRVQAIVNGSCNYILSRMARAGLSLEEAIAEAQARGFAEPDPSADVSGRDSAEKLAILAREAGFAGVEPADVRTTGIEQVTKEDLRLAAQSGRVIKLVAELVCEGESLSLRVGPTLLDLRHPLAGVHDEENAVVITTECAGTVTLRGKGAGPGPTATGVIGDVLRVARQSDVAPGATRRRRRVVARSERLHRVRVDGAVRSPREVLERIGVFGLDARDLLLTRRGVCLDAWGLEEGALALCRELGEGLVAPIEG